MPRPERTVRLAVFTDYAYKRADGGVHAERAFALFLDGLREHVAELTVVGRVDPRPGAGPYRLSGDVRFVELPFYETLTAPRAAARQMAGALRRFARLLDDVDAVWLLGPNPLALLFAVQARLRRRTVVLGVRQNTQAYLRSRHPRRRAVRLAGGLLEALWRLLARRLPVVVVGPELAALYRRAPRLLEASISLVRAGDVVDAPPRAPGDPIEVLSVGRLETEKNPLMLADVLARLDGDARRWRLSVCGEGPLHEELTERLAALGAADRARVLGYVPHERLTELYRASDLLLHVSWTEGLPQILFEAFAAGLPVVATDVGGIRAAVGELVELIPPGDPAAAAAALAQLAGDDARRAELTAAARAHVRAHTLEAETGRVARFVAEAAR